MGPETASEARNPEHPAAPSPGDPPVQPVHDPKGHNKNRDLGNTGENRHLDDVAACKEAD